MNKAEGAFLTISELSSELGLPQHILRYWETRFPQLRPLQRSGNRRYYRPADVVLVRRINQLLNDEGFTVRGAQKALADGGAHAAAASASPAKEAGAPKADLLDRLQAIRAALARAIGE
ncbi:MAG TPA: MerR family transcriptional regulator [Sphingobium sp.]